MAVKTILLVEDEVLIAMDTAAKLKKAGFAVRIVHSGEKAVKTALTEPIDLVLMDIDLGEGRMSGTEAARVILNTKDIPLVFLSSHTEPEVVNSTEGITSYGYIVKGSGDTVLLASLKMAFRLHEAHRDIKQRDFFLHSVFASVQDGISVLDSDLTIRHVNGVMKTWYPEKENIVGRKCYEVYQRRTVPCERCPTLRALKSGKTEREEVPGRSDSPVRWLEIFSYPMLDVGTDGMGGVVEFVRDITERKEAEQALKHSEERYRLITEYASDLIIQVNQDSQIVYINPAVTERLGYALEEVKGRCVLDFLPPEDRERIDRETRLHIERGEKRSILTFHVRGKDGKLRLMELHVNRIYDGGGTYMGTVGVARETHPL